MRYTEHARRERAAFQRTRNRLSRCENNATIRYNMKKTIITILALAGVAAAESLTLKTGLEYTATDGTKTLYDGTITPDLTDVIGYNKKDWPDGSVAASDLVLTVTLNEMYGVPQGIASNTAITLNKVVLRGEKNYCMDDSRRYTVSSGENTVSGLLANAKESLTEGSDIVFDLTGFTNLTMESVLTITLLPKEGTNSTNFSVGCADAWIKQGQTGSVAWTGVTSNRDITTSWGNECPLVTVYGSYTVPEPTTATLSLLALAGLAARRRRK